MMQRDVNAAEMQALRDRYLTLMRQELPARAAEEKWVIRFDHCFMRVVLDNMFGGRWYDHVPGRPAYKHLSAEQLQAAIDAAEAILERGAPLLNRLNDQSLVWRRAAKAERKRKTKQTSLLNAAQRD